MESILLKAFLMGQTFFFFNVSDEEEFVGCKADQQDLGQNILGENITMLWPATLPLCNISQPCPIIDPPNQGNFLQWVQNSPKMSHTCQKKIENCKIGTFWW